MNIRSQEKFIMKIRGKRDVLPWNQEKIRVDMCAPPRYKCEVLMNLLQGRMSLFPLKGSLTLEASMVLPFFLMVLLAFFSLFSQYASATQLKVSAAADAKKLGIVVGSTWQEASGDLTIYKTAKTVGVDQTLFWRDMIVVESATCRPWVGFSGVETEELYVYITPNGSVYHLYADCTHLKLSIQCVTRSYALSAKNEYGVGYRKCDLCKEPYGAMVYITNEGDCYHSERECSGLKRTIRRVPQSEVAERPVCLRCAGRGNES